MKKTVLFLLCLILASCDFLEQGYSIGNRRGEVFREAGGEREPPLHRLSDADSVVYVTGVDFPKDYDWRRDTAYGGVRFNLLVFANGRKAISIPAGDADKVSPDPDMHRFVQGKLYTNYTDGAKTIIKCNGSEIFSYDGAETMKGFLADGEDIYTLGQNRSGGGFVLRKNGGKVFGSEKGYILGNISESHSGTGALTKDDGVCFIYYIPFFGTSFASSQWFIVKDGRQGAVELPKNIDKLLDIRFFHNSIYILAEYRYRYVLFADNKQVYLSGCDPIMTRKLGFIKSEDDMFVAGEETDRKSRLKTKVWNLSGRLVLETPFGENALFIFPGQGKFAYPALEGGKSIGSVKSGGTLFPFKDNAYLLAGACGAYHNNKFYAAFTSAEPGSNPFLWVEGEKQTIELNGYLTSVNVVVKKEEEENAD